MRIGMVFFGLTSLVIFLSVPLQAMENWSLHLSSRDSNGTIFDTDNIIGQMSSTSDCDDYMDALDWPPPYPPFLRFYFPHYDGTVPEDSCPGRSAVSLSYDYRHLDSSPCVWRAKLVTSAPEQRYILLWDREEIPAGLVITVTDEEESTTVSLNDTSLYKFTIGSIGIKWLTIRCEWVINDLRILPATATIPPGYSLQFLAHDIVPGEFRQITPTWRVVGSGTITPDGVFTAGAVGETRVLAYTSAMTDTALVTVSSEMDARFDLRLSRGWNLISVPLYPSPCRVAELCAMLVGQVYTYDPRVNRYNRDSLLTAVKGYFILSARDTVLHLSGRSMANAPQVLYSGWNLIACRPTLIPFQPDSLLPTGSAASPNLYRYYPDVQSYGEVPNIEVGFAEWLLVTRTALLRFPE